ncbi:hypothetical protein IQ254_01780 [Nodosilinea sp. LEGE 07088]|uniref:hypothetical protein n=1 Tax=Nodosilinea sp. LEGE 07088 TaxID=2777968 RepID=UPI001881978C|nr:hypothetical protein [Nodosilinea sp. LEGE 07088]MBE9135945.1 hypothetical protein [Nodosilinea sp. LEGE 07088]
MNGPLILFISTCIGLVIWGILKKERVLQFPFFMGAIFISFLVPQAISLVNFPGVVPSHSIDRILIYGSLCVAMCWLGYLPKLYFLPRYQRVLSSRRLVRAAVALAIFGTVCFLMIGTVVPRPTSSQWTGPATILFFFSQTTWIGSIILLLIGLAKRKIIYIVLAHAGLLPLIASVLEQGRRTETATLLVMLAVAFFFSYRIIPPRWLSLLAIFLTMALIPLFAIMRGDVWEALFSRSLTLADLRFALDSLLSNESILELRNAALTVEAAQSTGKFGFGSGLWNRIIFQYVPGQLVGYELKDSLYIQLSDYDLEELFRYVAPTGSTFTGLGDSFREFSYFGCLVFAGMAYWFKHLWVLSTRYNNFYSQVLYISLVIPALLSVTHGIGRFTQDIIFRLIVVGAVIKYAQLKKSDADADGNTC